MALAFLLQYKLLRLELRAGARPSIISTVLLVAIIGLLTKVGDRCISFCRVLRILREHANNLAAICRRNGVYANAQGPHDFNAQL